MTANKLTWLPDVLKRVGVGRSKIYQMIKNNEFPAHVKLGRSSLWPENKVADWINERVEHG